MKKYIICDLDGTLADPAHRMHHVTGAKKDWDAFYAASKDDRPHRAIIDLVTSYADMIGADIWIVTGRSERVREDTVVWLNTHLDHYEGLVMRPRDCFTKDDMLKEEWLVDGTIPPREQVAAVFEDRSRVVQMWRSHGLLVLQVAEGDF